MYVENIKLLTSYVEYVKPLLDSIEKEDSMT